MRHDNIINALEVNCYFPEVFEEKESGGRYRNKLVHFRADYDGRKWWNTVWPCHDELATPEIRREVDSVYKTLVSKEVFADLETLRSFCSEFPQALANEMSTDEYDFYLESIHCGYWLRCITRAKDYNLYLHAFLLTDPSRQMYFEFLEELETAHPTWDTERSIVLLQRKFPVLNTNDAARFVFRWEFCFKATEREENEPTAH